MKQSDPTTKLRTDIAGGHSETAPRTTRADPRRPPLAAVVVGIVAVQVLFVFCLMYPPMHASPHDLPVGVAGPADATAPVRAKLADHSNGLEIHAYDDRAAASAAIRDREVYGAVAVTPDGPRLLVSSAADPKVATSLQARADALGEKPVPVTDVVPAAPDDPEGVGALTTVLPVVLLSIVLGAVIAITASGAARCLAWTLTGSVGAGLAVAGVTDAMGAFPGSYWACAGVLTLAVLGLSVTSAGLMRLPWLRPVEALFVLVVVLLGIPSAGALVPPEMLAQPWRAIGPYLPPAATLDALRGVTFFDGAAIGGALVVLGAWTLIGIGVLIGPTAARRRHGPTSTGPDKQPGAHEMPPHPGGAS